MSLPSRGTRPEPTWRQALPDTKNRTPMYHHTIGFLEDRIGGKNPIESSTLELKDSRRFWRTGDLAATPSGMVLGVLARSVRQPTSEILNRNPKKPDDQTQASDLQLARNHPKSGKIWRYGKHVPTQHFPASAITLHALGAAWGEVVLAHVRAPIGAHLARPQLDSPLAEVVEERRTDVDLWGSTLGCFVPRWAVGLWDPGPSVGFLCRTEGPERSGTSHHNPLWLVFNWVNREEKSR